MHSRAPSVWNGELQLEAEEVLRPAVRWKTISVLASSHVVGTISTCLGRGRLCNHNDVADRLSQNMHTLAGECFSNLAGANIQIQNTLNQSHLSHWYGPDCLLSWVSA